MTEFERKITALIKFLDTKNKTERELTTLERLGVMKNIYHRTVDAMGGRGFDPDTLSLDRLAEDLGMDFS